MTRVRAFACGLVIAGCGSKSVYYYDDSGSGGTGPGIFVGVGGATSSTPAGSGNVRDGAAGTTHGSPHGGGAAALSSGGATSPGGVGGMGGRFMAVAGAGTSAGGAIETSPTGGSAAGDADSPGGGAAASGGGTSGTSGTSGAGASAGNAGSSGDAAPANEPCMDRPVLLSGMSVPGYSCSACSDPIDKGYSVPAFCSDLGGKGVAGLDGLPDQFLLLLPSEASSSNGCDPFICKPQACQGANGAVALPGFVNQLWLNATGPVRFESDPDRRVMPIDNPLTPCTSAADSTCLASGNPGTQRFVVVARVGAVSGWLRIWLGSQVQSCSVSQQP